MSAEIQYQIRYLIIKKHLNGLSNATISRDLEIHPASVSRIIKKYLETLDYSVQTRGGDRRSILTDSHREFFIIFLQEDCQKTVKSLTEEIN